MKLFIASDIHGSSYWCGMMLDRVRSEHADRILLLGDLLYHGPRNDLPAEYNTKQTAADLNAYKDRIFCVRGNCDTEVDQMVLEFPIMAEYAVFPAGNSLVYVTHGHKYNTWNPPLMQTGDILLHGHTHVQACEKFGAENYYLNPGSVSIPKKDSVHGYMIYEDGVFTWKNIETGEVLRELRV